MRKHDYSTELATHICNVLDAYKWHYEFDAEGFLKPCLQYEGGTDLRRLLRQGASEQEIAGAIRQAVWEKPACHQFEQPRGEGTEKKNMNRIGG